MTDNTQDEPIMPGHDDATDKQKEDGRTEQERADAEFYEGKSNTNQNQPDPEPKMSAYSNPSTSDLKHLKK